MRVRTPREEEECGSGGPGESDVGQITSQSLDLSWAFQLRLPTIFSQISLLTGSRGKQCSFFPFSLRLEQPVAEQPPMLTARRITGGSAADALRGSGPC